MALAYRGDRFGSAQQAMKVADPVVLTAALPRFLTPGDSVIMPIMAFNTTAAPVSLTFKVNRGRCSSGEGAGCSDPRRESGACGAGDAESDHADGKSDREGEDRCAR